MVTPGSAGAHRPPKQGTTERENSLLIPWGGSKMEQGKERQGTCHLLLHRFWPHSPSFLLLGSLDSSPDPKPLWEPRFAFDDELVNFFPFFSPRTSGAQHLEHVMSEKLKLVLRYVWAQSPGKIRGWRCVNMAFLTQFLFAGLVAMKILTVVSPVLLRILLHRAAVWLQLLIQAAAVDEDRLAGLGVPSSLPKHLLQLLKGVAAFPLPNTVLLHAAVAPAKGLRQKKAR